MGPWDEAQDNRRPGMLPRITPEKQGTRYEIYVRVAVGQPAMMVIVTDDETQNASVSIAGRAVRWLERGEKDT